MSNLPAVHTGKPLPKLHSSSQAGQYVTFWLDQELFGVDILDVKEVTPLMEITPVFHAPPEVRGYVNIRGQIYLVVDLRYKMGIEVGTPGPEARIVIFKDHVAENFGVLVDRIGDVTSVDESQVETDFTLATSDREGLNQGLVAGVCKLKEKLLILVNARRVFADQG